MRNKKKLIKIAIDSPAAAGAGTLAKSISKHYNLFYLDTGKIYRFIAYLKLRFPHKFNLRFVRTKIKNLKIKDLSNKSLLIDEIGNEAAIISKDKKIRKLPLFSVVFERLEPLFFEKFIFFCFNLLVLVEFILKGKYSAK